MSPISNDGKDHAVRVILFWIVLAFVLVQSTGSIYLAQKAENTSNIGNNTTCVLIRFLDGSVQRTQDTVNKEPNSALTVQRQQAITQSRNLATDLRNTGVKC